MDIPLKRIISTATDIAMVVISLVNWFRLRKGDKKECRTEQKTKTE